jgi:hypothetical protein
MRYLSYFANHIAELAYSVFDSALYRNREAERHCPQENATSHNLTRPGLEGVSYPLVENRELSVQEFLGPLPADYRLEEEIYRQKNYRLKVYPLMRGNLLKSHRHIHTSGADSDHWAMPVRV